MPYKSKSTHRNQILNEYVLLYVFYSFICFSDITDDPVAKYQIGFVPCVLVSLHLGINMSILLIGMLKKLFRRIKRSLLLKIHLIKMS